MRAFKKMIWFKFTFFHVVFLLFFYNLNQKTWGKKCQHIVCVCKWWACLCAVCVCVCHVYNFFSTSGFLAPSLPDKRSGP